jgi:hypothetical protein
VYESKITSIFQYCFNPPFHWHQMTCKIQFTSISYIYSFLTKPEQRGTSKTIYKMRNINVVFKNLTLMLKEITVYSPPPRNHLTVQHNHLHWTATPTTFPVLPLYNTQSSLHHLLYLGFPKHSDTMLHQNTGTCIPNYRVSNLRRWSSSKYKISKKKDSSYNVIV